MTLATKHSINEWNKRRGGGGDGRLLIDPHHSVGFALEQQKTTLPSDDQDLSVRMQKKTFFFTHDAKGEGKFPRERGGFFEIQLTNTQRFLFLLRYSGHLSSRLISN